MPAKVTRRRLGLLAAPLMAKPVPAQEPPAADDLEIQRQNQRRARESMAKAALPRHIEPATVFKA